MFAVTQYNSPSCTLPATIAITRTGGGTLGLIDESTYVANADSASNFRIDPTACHYIYNLAATALGVGMYRVDISINAIMLGHAVFALKWRSGNDSEHIRVPFTLFLSFQAQVISIWAFSSRFPRIDPGLNGAAIGGDADGSPTEILSTGKLSIHVKKAIEVFDRLLGIGQP